MATTPTPVTLTKTAYDILNAIRDNASMSYQNNVPEATAEDGGNLRQIGQIIVADSNLRNEFVNALINRIALTVTRSAMYSNPYANLKKGFLEFGETVQEAFVNMAKAREFSSVKAEQRELKRTVPDVKSVLHPLNWRVQYPVTIELAELKRAFLSENGLNDLVSRINNSLVTAAQYDEFLLFKYLLIKGITSGKVKPIQVSATNIKDSLVKYRSHSNKFTFMSNEYNEAKVTTVCPRENQQIFISSDYDAKVDVEALAAAFHMEKADFIGHRHLIDDWNTFDNERFNVIRENSGYIDTVTEEELALMSHVVGVLADAEYFQVYDELAEFSENRVASGLYHNLYYNDWKIVASSPYSNIVVFVDDIVAFPDSNSAE